MSLYEKGLMKQMLDSVQLENKIVCTTIAGLERKFMKTDRLTTYIACEELDFTWSNEQVREFDKRWREGRKHGRTSLEMIAELSKRFKRLPEEIVILTMDRGMKSKL
jgi:hypothetical protein